MTREERKRLGKHWKQMAPATQAKHMGFETYYTESKTEIDAELKKEVAK